MKKIKKSNANTNNHAIALKSAVLDFINIAKNKSKTRQEQIISLTNIISLFDRLCVLTDVKTNPVDDVVNSSMTPWVATRQALNCMVQLADQLNKHMNKKDKHMCFVILDNFKENLYFVVHSYNVTVDTLTKELNK